MSNETTFKNAVALAEAGVVTDRPVYLFGPPGIGKSALPTELCRRHEDWGYVLFNSSQLDTIDYRGLPTVDAGNTTWNMPDLFKQINKMAEEKEIVLVGVDEISQAALHTTGVLYQMLQFKAVGPHKLADNVRFIALGNLPKHGSGVDRPVNPILLNRGMAAEMTRVTPKEWLAWAYRSGVHPAVTAFIDAMGEEYLFKFTPDNMTNPTPRSWETVSNYLNAVMPADDINNLSLWEDAAHMTVLKAAVGNAAAAQLGITMESLKTLGSITDINDILTKPSSARLIKTRIDGVFLASVLAGKVTADNAEKPMRYFGRTKWKELPAVYLSTLAAMGKIAALTDNKQFTKSLAKYSSVISEFM